MKAKPLTVTITFATEKEAKLFCSAYFYDYMDGRRIAQKPVEAELARRRKAKRDAKKAALVVERQGDSYMLKRDWK